MSCIFTNPQANWSDTKWIILQKILCALNSGGGSGGGGATLGVVDPTGVVTPSTVGQLYINTATGTTWVATALTSADWQQIV